MAVINNKRKFDPLQSPAVQAHLKRAKQGEQQPAQAQPAAQYAARPATTGPVNHRVNNTMARPDPSALLRAKAERQQKLAALPEFKFPAPVEDDGPIKMMSKVGIEKLASGVHSMMMDGLDTSQLPQRLGNMNLLLHVRVCKDGSKDKVYGQIHLDGQAVEAYLRSSPGRRADLESCLQHEVAQVAAGKAPMRSRFNGSTDGFKGVDTSNITFTTWDTGNARYKGAKDAFEDFASQVHKAAIECPFLDEDDAADSESGSVVDSNASTPKASQASTQLTSFGAASVQTQKSE